MTPVGGGAGGNGGGAISIQAQQIVVTGRISANGADGGSAGLTNNTRGGGGGSGGSILLRAATLDLGSGLVTATGGAGGFGIHDGDPSKPARGGAGGVGRIRIEYTGAVTGTTSPVASVAQPVTTTDLVVSTVASESSDGQAHTAANPYLIPLDAQYTSLIIKSGAYASTTSWNGTSGGTLRFTASGTVRIDGTLTVDHQQSLGLARHAGRELHGAGPAAGPDSQRRWRWRW
jgi:hypothetical protein